MDTNTLGQTSVAGFQWSAGIAYITIPTDIDRDVFIAESYKNGRVSMRMEDGCFFNQVPIDIDVLNFITFPSQAKEFGTAVVFVLEPTHNQPIIVARLPKNDTVGNLKENQFRISRKLGKKIIELSG